MKTVTKKEINEILTKQKRLGIKFFERSQRIADAMFCIAEDFEKNQRRPFDSVYTTKKEKVDYFHENINAGNYAGKLIV